MPYAFGAPRVVPAGDYLLLLEGFANSEGAYSLTTVCGAVGPCGARVGVLGGSCEGALRHLLLELVTMAAGGG